MLLGDKIPLILFLIGGLICTKQILLEARGTRLTLLGTQNVTSSHLRIFVFFS